MLILLGLILAGNSAGCSRLFGVGQGLEGPADGSGAEGAAENGSGSNENKDSGPADSGHGSAGGPEGQGSLGTDGLPGAGGPSGGDRGDGFPYTWNRGRGADIRLPESYDYRKTGRAPQIGNQGSLGTCWAFASLTALESSLLPTDRETFAVDHMTMHNSFLLGQDEGGE